MITKICILISSPLRHINYPLACKIRAFGMKFYKSNHFDDIEIRVNGEKVL